MDYAGFASLCLRVAGIIILAAGLPAVPNSFVAIFAVRDFASHPTLTLLASAVLASSGSLIVGLALVLFPAAVANRLIKADMLVVQDSRAYRELQTLAFSVLGLYFVSVGIFDAIYWYARTHVYLQAMTDAAKPALPRDILAEESAGYITAVIYFVGGLLLLFGARGIASILSRLRRSGEDDR